MNEIILNIPTPIPTMAIDCITMTNRLNNSWIIKVGQIALLFVCVGLVLGVILGYLYREKYGSQ